jgi:broad specificity phosphatase PhoE
MALGFSSGFHRWLVLSVLLLLVLLAITQSNSPIIERMVTAGESGSETTTSIGTTLRFYLVRHGETLANIQKIVVGQSDSPLTTLGQRQASALGETSFIKNTAFWRRYASDLPRTQQTAKLIDSSNSFVLDDRLREIAKGARQGFPKSYTLEQCLEWFQHRPEEIPLSETSDDAWKRLSSFFIQIFEDALKENSDRSMMQNILIICHSGSLRLLLHKLVPGAHPLLSVTADTKGSLDDNNRFQIPNTSLTILDLTIPDSVDIKDLDEAKFLESVAPKLVELNWIGHYDSV